MNKQNVFFLLKQFNNRVLRWEFSLKINKRVGSNKAHRWENFLKKNRICCVLIREFRVLSKWPSQILATSEYCFLIYLVFFIISQVHVSGRMLVEIKEFYSRVFLCNRFLMHHKTIAKKSMRIKTYNLNMQKMVIHCIVSLSTWNEIYVHNDKTLSLILYLVLAVRIRSTWPTGIFFRSNQFSSLAGV